MRLYYNRKGSLTVVCTLLSSLSCLFHVSFSSLLCLFQNKRIKGEEAGRIDGCKVSLSGKPTMPIGIFVAFQSVLLRCFGRYFCGEMYGVARRRYTSPTVSDILERPGKIYCIGQVSIALFNVSSI